MSEEPKGDDHLGNLEVAGSDPVAGINRFAEEPMEHDTDEYELDEDFEDDKPWETFNISEDAWTEVWKQVQHVNIDAETIADLFNGVFPDGTQAAKAYACFLALSDDFDE